ncbi:hypothetical protein [Lacrimispora sp.]
MNPANFFSFHRAGILKDYGTPPKVYGQMLKVSRRKRKIRKRKV